MNDRSQADMLEAARLTRAGRLAEAAALVRQALQAGAVPGDARAPGGKDSRIIDAVAETIGVADRPPSPDAARPFEAGDGGRPGWTAWTAEGLSSPHLPEAIRDLVERATRLGSELNPGDLAASLRPKTPAVAVPEIGRASCRERV